MGEAGLVRQLGISGTVYTPGGAGYIRGRAVKTRIAVDDELADGARGG